MASFRDIKKLYKIDKRCFSTVDIAKILSIENQRNLENTVKKLINEGVLTVLEKGKYYLTDNIPNSFEIAQFLYSPSYVSFETALNYHGVLSQFPFEISSATTKKRTIKIVEGKIYSYIKIDKKLFTGYYLENNYLIATKEKALFDQIYLTSRAVKAETTLENIEFQQIDKNILIEFTKLLSIDSLKRFNNILNKYI